MSGQFDKYIRDGNAAMETHPDFSDFELGEIDALAADTIASVMHAVDAAKKLTPHEARARMLGNTDEAFGLLERAYRSYCGDFEDLAGGAPE